MRETVQALNGCIDLKSVQGEGTTFDIYLPAARREAAGAARVADGDPADSADSRQADLVFVDDEASLARLGRRRLEAAGYRVTAFTSSMEALEQLRTQSRPPDLLITDNTMPRLSGLDLARETVELHPGLPVLMVSGLARIRLEDIPDYVTRVLPKPHSGDELVSAVRELLEDSGPTGSE